MKKLLLLFVLLIGIGCDLHTYAQGWQWMKGATNGETHGEYVVTDMNGNVYGAGINFGYNDFGPYTTPARAGGAGNLVLVKYDSLGNIGWLKYYNSPLGSIPAGLATDPFGNVYLIGIYRDSIFNFYGQTLLNPNWPGGSACFFIAKINVAGDVVWLRNIGNVSEGWGDVANDITIDQCGNIYVACPFWNNPVVVDGSSFTNAGYSNFIVAKLDSSGSFIWAKSFGGNNTVVPGGIRVTSSGNIIIAGNFSSDTLQFGDIILTDTSTISNISVFIVKLDNFGVPIWAKTNKGGTDCYISVGGVATDQEENAFISGEYFRPVPSGYSGYTSIDSYVFPVAIPGQNYGFLLKFDSAGVISWVKNMSDASGGAATIDACQNIWIYGSLDLGVDTIDRHEIVAPSFSHAPSYVAGWSNAGTYISANPLPTGDISSGGYVSDITSDRGSNIYIAGTALIDTFILAGDTLYGSTANFFLAKYNPALGCPYETTPPLCHLDTIAGGRRLCIGGTTTLSDAEAGGRWSSSNTAIATIDSVTGVVTGVAPGSAIITYTFAGSSITAIVTIGSTPPLSISGPSELCPGATITLTDASSGGTWSGSNTGVATIGSPTGIVAGVAAGTAIMSYSFGTTGCTVTKIITVEPLPEMYSVTGGGSYCVGGTGADVGLSGSGMDVQYQLYYSASATGSPLTGTGSTLDFGLQTLTGTYTVVATNLVTGCTQNMADSAVITITPVDTTYVIHDTTICYYSDAQVIILTAPSFTGGIWFSGSIAATDTINAPGAYWFIYPDTTGCAFTAYTFQVAFVPLPSPISGSNTVCSGDTIMLNDFITGGTWASSALAIASVNAANGIVSAISAGVDTITYSLLAGCSVTQTITIITPPCTTGVPSIVNNNTLEIFPNPADDELTIQTNAVILSPVEGQITITNNIGQQLIQQQIASTLTTVNIQSLPPGMYYITLKGENGSVVKKFVKE